MSIQHCCQSASPNTLFPCSSRIDARHSTSLHLPIYFSAVGGTTDQSVVNNQCQPESSCGSTERCRTFLFVIVGRARRDAYMWSLLEYEDLINQWRQGFPRSVPQGPWASSFYPRSNQHGFCCQIPFRISSVCTSHDMKDGIVVFFNIKKQTFDTRKVWFFMFL